MPDLPELWTSKQVATRLNVTPETVRRLIRAGRLGCYRLGGCTRVSPDQVAVYLQASLRAPREVLATLVEPTDQRSAIEEFRWKQSMRRALEPRKGKP